MRDHQTITDLFPEIPSRRKSSPIPKKIVRIRLGEAASQALDETGLPAFGVVGCEREPGQPRRWVLYLAELRHPAAQEAIALIKTSSASNPPTPA